MRVTLPVVTLHKILNVRQEATGTMRTLATYILRVIWLLLLVAFGWNLATGKLAIALHPFNVVLAAVIVVGSITIWFSTHAARMVAAICGVIAGVMWVYQVWSWVSMFSGLANVEFRMSYGPAEFEGVAAQIALWLPPLLLLGFSGELLIHQWRHRPISTEKMDTWTP
jgi:hypothetical protein